MFDCLHYKLKCYANDNSTCKLIRISCFSFPLLTCSPCQRFLLHNHLLLVRHSLHDLARPSDVILRHQTSAILAFIKKKTLFFPYNKTYIVSGLSYLNPQCYWMVNVFINPATNSHQLLFYMWVLKRLR